MSHTLHRIHRAISPNGIFASFRSKSGRLFNSHFLAILSRVVDSRSRYESSEFVKKSRGMSGHRESGCRQQRCSRTRRWNLFALCNFHSFPLGFHRFVTGARVNTQSMRVVVYLTIQASFRGHRSSAPMESGKRARQQGARGKKRFACSSSRVSERPPRRKCETQESAGARPGATSSES